MLLVCNGNFAFADVLDELFAEIPRKHPIEPIANAIIPTTRVFIGDFDDVTGVEFEFVVVLAC